MHQTLFQATKHQLLDSFVRVNGNVLQNADYSKEMKLLFHQKTVHLGQGLLKSCIQRNGSLKIFLLTVIIISLLMTYKKIFKGKNFVNILLGPLKDHLFIRI